MYAIRSYYASSSFLLETQLKEGIVYGDRNYCNFWGYETLALIPLKFEDKRQGLIQFNDTRKGVFSKELIEYLEGIALQIGIAIVITSYSIHYTKLYDPVGGHGPPGAPPAQGDGAPHRAACPAGRGSHPERAPGAIPQVV